MGLVVPLHTWIYSASAHSVPAVWGYLCCCRALRAEPNSLLCSYLRPAAASLSLPLCNLSQNEGILHEYSEKINLREGEEISSTLQVPFPGLRAAERSPSPFALHHRGGWTQLPGVAAGCACGGDEPGFGALGCEAVKGLPPASEKRLTCGPSASL